MLGWGGLGEGGEEGGDYKAGACAREYLGCFVGGEYCEGGDVAHAETLIPAHNVTMPLACKGWDR